MNMHYTDVWLKVREQLSKRYNRTIAHDTKICNKLLNGAVCAC